MNEIDPAKPRMSKTVRRLFVVAAVCTILLGLLILMLPTIATQTGLRNVLLAKALPSNIAASCEHASIGWFSPLDAKGISVADANGRWTIDAAGAASEKNLLQLISNATAVGELIIEKPVVTVNIDAWAMLPKQDQEEPTPAKSKTDISVSLTVRDARIQTITNDDADPNVIADHVTVSADFQRSASSETLTIEPGKPIDQAQLSPEMCRSLLKYVAPVVSNTAWTEGAVSVELDECTIPFDRPHEAIVSGTVTIHSVKVGVREGVGRQVTQLVATLTKKDIPTKVQLADNSAVEFVVANGVVSHRGLAFGLPEISDELVIETHGLVGFDKRLDLEAKVPLPFHLLGDGAIAQALGSETLYVPITGTLDEPEMRLDSDGQVAKLIGKVANPLISGETSVEDLLSGLRLWRENRRAARATEADSDSDVDDPAAEQEDVGPGLFERFRSRRRLFRRDN